MLSSFKSGLSAFSFNKRPLGAEDKGGYQGYVDMCHQSHIAGWAVDSKKQPSSVDLFLNGKLLARVPPNNSRDDLAAAGLPREAGFNFNFPEPLTVSDTLEVRFPNGAHLVNSPCTWHQERLRRLLRGISLDTMVGIELGPLDRPLLSKQKTNVKYVDHADRDGLIKKYKANQTIYVDIDKICDIDFIWSGGPIRNVIPQDITFDYCVAAHVIEHVPNPIGWLSQIASVIKPGGLINLAIPEKTRTFDHFRALSTPSDLVDAYIRNLERPSVKQVFDFIAFMSYIEPKPVKTSTYNDEKLKSAFQAAVDLLSNNHYHDVHCNVWTLDSFIECWEVIRRLKLLPLSLEETFEPYAHTDEFVVSFRRM